MQLISVRVQNYKCIDDSGEFTISDLTCLAGKNEAGKTAVLQALRRLNPVEEHETKFNMLMEYPRRRFREAESGTADSRHVLTTRWQLSDDDQAHLVSQVGIDTIPDTTVTIRKGYDNTLEWDLALDHGKAIEFTISQVPELTEATKDAVRSKTSLHDVYEYLSQLESSNERTKSLLKYLDDEFNGGDLVRTVVALLTERLPRFLFFPTYGTLPGKVHIESVADQVAESHNEGDRLFLALLALAGTDIHALRNTRLIEELRARLEGVSNHLSDTIFEYWTQNDHLQVVFSYDEARPDDTPPFNSGHVLSLRVFNSRHRVTVGFDERSTGFVWFFSFLVWFSQMESEHGDDLIILLDEPGLSLHGKAQQDLLRYIREQLLDKYQVVYTTHSPFMIDIDNILGVRTVEDSFSKRGRPIGTKIRGRALSADADTLLPLRYDITQTLFIGNHSLLVEGPSDLLVIKWASKQLRDRGRLGLDDRWTVTPVGGITKLGSFAALFAAHTLHVAVFTDFHRGDKAKIRKLRESGLLESGHVFTAAEFTNTDEADIEDMLGMELYCRLVNDCYKIQDGNELPVAESTNVARVIEHVEQHFRTEAIDVPEFDHFVPSIYLIENETRYGDLDATEVALTRFEALFGRLNNLLR